MRGDRQKGVVLMAVVLALSLIAAVALLLNRGSGMNLESSSSQEMADVARAAAEAGLNHAIWQIQQSNCVGYVAINNTPFGSPSFQAAYSSEYHVEVQPNSGSPVLVSATAVLQKNGTEKELSRLITVYEPPITVTLQPDAADGKETMLNSMKPDRNYGADALETIDYGWNQHFLIQFDLSSIPAGVRILSATLELNVKLFWYGGNFTAHLLTAPWTEGICTGSVCATGATWNTTDGATAWAVEGGDFSPEVLDTVQVASIGWKSWDITPAMKSWNSGVLPNYGVLLDPQVNGSMEVYTSDYGADPSLRPKLIVIYSCECGQSCETFCEADYTPNVVQDEFSSSAIGAADVQAITYLPESVSFNSVAAPAGGAWILIDSVDQRFYMTDMAGLLLTSLAIPLSNAHGGVFINSGDYADHLAVTNTSGGLIYIDMDGNNVSGTLAPGSSQAAGVGFVGTSSSRTYDDHILILDRSSETVLIRTQAGAAANSFSVNDGTSAPVQDVKHLPGTDKVIITYHPDKAAIYDFTGSKLREYNLSGFGITLTESTAINPLTCEHVVADKGSDRVITLSSCNADYSPTGIAFEFTTAGYSERLNRGVTYFPEGQVLNGVTSPTGGAWIAVGGSGILWMVGMDGTELDGGYKTGLSQLEGITFVPAANPTDPGHLAIVKGSSLYYSDMSLPASASFTTHWLPFVTNAGGVSYIYGGTHDGHLAIADMSSGEIHIIDSSFNLVKTLATDSILFAPEGIAHLKYSDKFLVIDTGLSAALVLDTSLTVSQKYDLTPFSLGAPTGAAAAIHPTSCDHFFGDRPNNRYAYLNTGGGIAPQILTLNPVADSMVDENSAGANYGSDDTLKIGTSALLLHYQSIFRFDVSVLPAGATVSAATLRLYNIAGFGKSMDVGAYRITVTWDEGTVTWDSFGGGYDAATQLGVASVNPKTAGWNEWVLPPALIHKWIDGVPGTNQGLLLRYEGNDKNYQYKLTTREYAVPTLQPQLVIEYTTP